MWDWRYRDNWEPVKKPGPLEDGTVWHKALEVLYNPETWGLPLVELHKLAHEALMSEANKMCSEYLHRAGKYQLDEEEALDYGDRLSILRSMLVKLCRNLDRTKYKPLYVEKEFECPILDEHGRQLYCCCKSCRGVVERLPGDQRHELAKLSQSAGAIGPGLPVTFNCRIDAVFEDQEGFVFVVDHKSAANLTSELSIIPEIDDQLPSYLWCLRQNGLPATGAILNQFRKAYPKPPKRLEHAQQGRQYSVSRMQLTDYHVASQVFRRNDPAAFRHGLYKAYLDWLKEFGPEYSRQFVIIKTNDHLDQIGLDIARQAKEVTGEPSIYPSPSQMNCQGCSFQVPCLTASGGNSPIMDLEASFIKSEPYYIQRRRQS